MDLREAVYKALEDGGSYNYREMYGRTRTLRQKFLPCALCLRNLLNEMVDKGEIVRNYTNGYYEKC